LDLPHSILFFLQKNAEVYYRVYSSPTYHLAGSKTILAFLKKLIGLHGTTANGRFTLEKTSCMGQCDKSPAMMINGKVYTNKKKSGRFCAG
jgi:NADH:ubiquinone oxidoreductase subunit E